MKTTLDPRVSPIRISAKFWMRQHFPSTLGMDLSDSMDILGGLSVGKWFEVEDG